MNEINQLIIQKEFLCDILKQPIEHLQRIETGKKIHSINAQLRHLFEEEGLFFLNNVISKLLYATKKFI